MAAVNIGVRKFNPAELNRCPVIRIIGKRGTGKTYLANHLASQNGSAQAYVIDPMHECHGDYNWIPAERRFRDVSSGWLTALVHQQHPPDASSATVIIDNLEIVSHPSTRDVFTQVLFAHNRFSKITTITIEQYPNARPPIQRTSTDFVFIMRESVPAVRRRLFDQHGSAFPSFSVFCQVLDQVTREPYECLVLDLTKHEATVENSVFWYRAPNPT